jgi:hypothetical protein
MGAVPMEVSMSTATEIKEPEVNNTVPVADPQLELRSAPPRRIERLFANVLLETGGTQRRRRTLTAVLSFVVQSKPR